MGYAPFLVKQPRTAAISLPFSDAKREIRTAIDHPQHRCIAEHHTGSVRAGLKNLELGDDKWLSSYMTAEDIKAIQLYTTSWSTKTTSTGWNTKANFWLLNFLCFANVISQAQPNKISDQAQCSADDFGGGNVSQVRQYAQVIIMSVMMLAIFCLCGALWQLWKRLLAMKILMEEHTNRALMPIIERVIDLECHHGEVTVELESLRRQSAENRGDLETLFRAVRHASPHPEEPARQRLRLTDARPAAEEPDGEQAQGDSSPQPEEESPQIRSFREDASRSRDGDREGADTEDFEEEYDYTDDPSFDDVIHDPEEYDRRVRLAHEQARHNLRAHHLTIQGNNLQVAIHTYVQQHFDDGRIPSAVVDQLYSQHAPYIPLVGQEQEDEGVLNVTFRGETHFILQEGENQIQFRSLEGLHGFRCARYAAREDARMNPEERHQRIQNYMLHYQRIL